MNQTSLKDTIKRLVPSGEGLAKAGARRVQERLLVRRRLQDGTSIEYTKTINRIDISGCRFGLWTAIERAGKSKTKCDLWRCVCDCGKSAVIQYGNLASFLSTSCGCDKRFRIKHGMTNSREWICWRNMKNRCLKKSNLSYKHYGGRGIKICDSWVNSFESFFRDMGPCPSGFEIERINNDGDYEPSNCKWASKKEQSDNKRSTRRITFNGSTKTTSEWAALIKVKRQTLYNRLFVLKWDIEKSLTKQLTKQHLPPI